MASLYAQYIKEITDDHILEIEHGFATYRYLNDGKTVYIIDIFVAPEARKKGIAFTLVNTIVNEAKEKGCKELLGTILPSMKLSTISMMGHIAYGMKLHSVSNNAIIMRKDI